ncbi:MAG: Flp pilus assembly protein CpaB [Myxococcota bacterium]
MNRTALLAAVLVSVVGVALFGLYMRRFQYEARGGALVRVLATNEDIDTGDAITRAQLIIRELPERYVETRHVLASDLDKILGIRAANAVRAQQSLLWTDLDTGEDGRRFLAELLGPQMRAVTVKVGGAASFAGLLRAGDLVDLFFTGEQPGTDGVEVTVPLLDGALVLAIGADTGGDQVDPDAREGQRYTDVSLAVTLDQAARLTHAAERGQIRMALRNPDDVEPMGATHLVEIDDLIPPAPPPARGPRPEPEDEVTVEGERARGPVVILGGSRR